MKKRKLQLKRQTIRALRADRLRAVEGAVRVQGPCTEMKSGCNSGLTVCAPGATNM